MVDNIIIIFKQQCMLQTYKDPYLFDINTYDMIIKEIEDSITNNTDPLEKIKNILINKTFRIEEEIREKVLENKVFNKKLEIKTKHNNYYENNEKLEDDNSGQKIINIPIYKIEINRLSIKQVEKLLRYHYYKFYHV